MIALTYLSFVCSEIEEKIDNQFHQALLQHCGHTIQITEIGRVIGSFSFQATQLEG